MATTFTNATFSNTYRDDFLDSDGYHKILFNSGRTLQARELTQMQTIIQKQIQRFGDNIFKEGSVVSEGSFSPNAKYEFIKLNTSVNTLPSNYTSLVGTSFTGQTSGIIVKVLEVVPAEGSDPATLYVQYTSTSASTDSTTSPIRMQAGENISNGSTTLTVQTTNTVANRAVGTGYQFSIGQGIYYSKGFFIFCDSQSKIISKYSDAPSADIGFKIIEDIVTVADDTGLYDNQGATPNISAPGADRYRIRLQIATRNDIDSDENFIHTHTILKGTVTSTIKEIDAYAVPNELISKRIFENSGNYFVKPFTIRFEEDSSDNDKLVLKVSDGIAVVEGYRAATYVPTDIRINKSTKTTVVNNDVVSSEFGNYVLVSPTGNTKGIPNINTFEKMNLRDTADYGGSTIGTARVRAITEDGANYRYHLFDIVMNSGQAFRDVKSIGTSITNYFNPTLENSKAVLKETSNNNLLFSLRDQRPKSLVDISSSVQRRFATTTNVSGETTITLSGAGETFANTGDWIFANADSDVYTGSVSVSGAGTASATITGLPASSSNLEILAYVNKGNGSVRTKTLTDRSITATIDSDGNGTKFVPLGKADIFSVTEIINASDSNENYSNRFTLDNGQRDNFYALGRMVLNGGSSAPGGNIHVKYKHFTHGTSGDFFAVNSYTGQVAYNQIPSHRTNQGEVISLRNVLDFRSIQDSDEAYTNSATGARVNELPQPTDLIRADITYYLANASRLVIDTEGTLKYIEGTSGFTPRLPQQPEQTLGLYNIFLNPNTLDNNDVITQKIEAKRYTMADIGVLESRIDQVEELASLSLLELATTNFEVLDSAGLSRTKSGVVVDNFTTQSLTANDDTYLAAIDPIGQTMRPWFTEDNVKLIYDSDASTNTIKKGDNIYLKYDEEIYINQNLASKSIQINPFSVIVHEGIITLSPSSDEWRDTEYLAEKIIQGGTKLETDQALLWNNWNWNWGGTKIEDLKIGSQTNVKTSTSGNTKTTIVNKVVADEIVRTEIGDRVVDVTLLPFMRSKKVFFKAEGLRPNSKVFAFFDNKSVANWVRSESFAYYSDDTTDYGNTYNNASAHPDGSTTLETDANGSVTGSFFIPNTTSFRFRTGVREFKILDISVNNENDSLSIGRAIYTATGYLDTRQKDILSTRVLTVEGTKSQSTVRSWQQHIGNRGKSQTGPGYTSYDGGNTWSSNRDRSFDGGRNEGGPDRGGRSSSGGGHPGMRCLTEDMKVMINGVIDFVTNVKVGDIVGSSVVMEVLHKHMREGYYIVNNELKITNDHPVLVNGFWKCTEDLTIGDNINGVEVTSLEYIQQLTPTVYIGTANDQYDVYAGKNVYTVHGQYKNTMKKVA